MEAFNVGESYLFNIHKKYWMLPTDWIGGERRVELNLLSDETGPSWHSPSSPVRHVDPAVLGETFHDADNLGDTPGKQGLDR